MDTASPDGFGDVAYNVEQCQCPSQYVGTSCEVKCIFSLSSCHVTVKHACYTLVLFRYKKKFKIENLPRNAGW